MPTANVRTRWWESHIVTNAVEFVGFLYAYPIRSANRERDGFVNLFNLKRRRSRCTHERRKR